MKTIEGGDKKGPTDGNKLKKSCSVYIKECLGFLTRSGYFRKIKTIYF